MGGHLTARGRDRALWAFIGAMAAAAVAVHWFAVRPLSGPMPAEGWLWAVAVALAFFGVELLSVNLRRGGQSYGFSMMETPLVVGLFFVHPMLLAVCRVLGSTAAFSVRRRPVQKTACNAAMFSLETACAVTIWHALVAGGDPLGPRGWLATAVAILVMRSPTTRRSRSTTHSGPT